MSELITDSGKIIADKTGMIENTAGMINGDAGMMDDNTGMININREGISEKISKRRKRSRERGPDKQPRKYNPITLGNLKQFRNIPLEKPNDSNLWFWIIIGIVIAVIAIILGWKIYEWWKEKQEEKGKTEKSFVVLLNSNR